MLDGGITPAGWIPDRQVISLWVGPWHHPLVAADCHLRKTDKFRRMQEE